MNVEGISERTVTDCSSDSLSREGDCYPSLSAPDDDFWLPYGATLHWDGCTSDRCAM